MHKPAVAAVFGKTPHSPRFMPLKIQITAQNLQALP
jgi:hypothetical protein